MMNLLVLDNTYGVRMLFPLPINVMPQLSLFMAAVPIGSTAYISFAPPWSHRMFKMGRLGFPPGAVPEPLRPYLLKKGDVSSIVSSCRSSGHTGGTGLVKCIFSTVGRERAKK